MIGTDRDTGRALAEDAHLAQSIRDVLSTPRGTLVMLRDYGSDLPDIIDQPITPETMIDVYLATAEALAAWEPRIILERVQLLDARPGRAEIDLQIKRADQTSSLQLEIAT